MPASAEGHAGGMATADAPGTGKGSQRAGRRSQRSPANVRTSTGQNRASSSSSRKRAEEVDDSAPRGAAGTAVPVATAEPQGPVAQRDVMLELIPSASLGPFHLGMGVTTALERITEEYVTFPRVHVVFDDAASPTSDILLQLPTLGVCLRFEPVNQQLRRIDFWPSDHLTVRYKGRVVMEPKSTAYFKNTRDMFGPCTGEFERASKAYLLRYPGVTLGFGVPGDVREEEIDLQKNGRFADGTAAALCCGAVITGVDAKSCPSPAAPLVRVRTVRGSGLMFEDGRQALFGDTCQDIVAKLGAPCSTFRPVDSAWIGGAQEGAGVFFNYRRLGIDVQFDLRQHRACKFVLHANVPGHYDFGVYTKCNFACEVRATGLTKGSIDAHAQAMQRSCIDLQPSRVVSGGLVPPGFASGGSGSGTEDAADESFRTISDTLSTGWDSSGEDTDGGSINRKLGSSITTGKSPLAAGSGTESMLVTPETKWEQVLRQFKMPKPVTMQPPPAPNTDNPFGVTHLYNDGPFTFETVPRSGRIATVTFVPLETH
eukprot:m.175975 g.175975  ORF g.175975 m.175975 type:complete len:542 (+) comp14086_c0_seq1:262-1887(+)